jgi:P pilus assembly chaperone PapD
LKRFALLALLLPGIAAAGDFAINPMRVDFAPGQRAAEIKVQNFDKVAVRFRVRASDCEGAICTAPTNELLYFPRALEIQPGEARIVRVGLRSFTPSARRFAVQLQQVDISEAAEAAGAHVQLLLNIEVGVTVPGARAAVR